MSLLSYLAKVGAAAYAAEVAEWHVCVNMLTCKWADILVCPVIFIHSSEIPRYLFGELLILHTWFRKIYTGTNQGLLSAWDMYAEVLFEFSLDLTARQNTSCFYPSQPRYIKAFLCCTPEAILARELAASTEGEKETHCEKSLFVLASRQKIPVLRTENPAVDTRTICLLPNRFF